MSKDIFVCLFRSVDRISSEGDSNLDSVKVCSVTMEFLKVGALAARFQSGPAIPKAGPGWKVLRFSDVGAERWL